MVACYVGFTLTSRRIRFGFSGFMLLLVIVSPAAAWNSLGHKVVAEIAWQQLDPATRQAIVDTLRRHPRFDTDFQAPGIGEIGCVAYDDVRRKR
jgi:hypothetical protein